MKRINAFTLIELLIVVAIIAILAAIAVPNFLEAQVRSKVSRSNADMRSLGTALEAYAVDYTKFPPIWVSQDKTMRNATSYVNGVQGLVGNGVHPRIQRLAYLTTPVAYISRIQNDPFAPGPSEANPLNLRYPVFTYWDPPFTDASKVNTNGATWYQDFGGLFNNRGAWSLISYGPDKDFEPAYWSPTAVWRLYDSSNGTVSNGDIWRFGGSGIPKK